MAAINLIQISDCHLFADQDQLLKGVNSEENFLKVLALLQHNESKIDALLMTGDLADKGEVQAYQRMRQHLAIFNCPIYYLPGNHDDLNNIVELNSTNILSDKLISLEHWDLILLNSVLPGKTEGYLDQTQQDFLSDALQRTDKFKLIALHHHPYTIPSKAFADSDLRNRDAFWQIIREASPELVKVIVCGHVHQVYEAMIEQVAFLTCPSTAIQFNPSEAVTDYHDPAFTVDTPPGYRWMKLFDDGNFESDICRVSG